MAAGDLVYGQVVDRRLGLPHVDAIGAAAALDLRPVLAGAVDVHREGSDGDTAGEDPRVDVDVVRGNRRVRIRHGGLQRWLAGAGAAGVRRNAVARGPRR